jgi:hypothetical protein
VLVVQASAQFVDGTIPDSPVRWLNQALPRLPSKYCTRGPLAPPMLSRDIFLLRKTLIL